MTDRSRLAVIGLGLIGGSLARAVRQGPAAPWVIGFTLDPLEAAEAEGLGVVDATRRSAAEAVEGAALVVVAVPPAAMAEVFRAIAPALGPATVVTDVGSVKASVVAAARAELGQHWPRFVPGHPLAGAEKSGVAAGHAGLFQGQRVLLTPLPETDPAAVATVTRLWQECGAVVETLGVAVHDEVLALTSHLPHVLAYALVHEVRNYAGPVDPFRYTGGGFRDFTRIAASDPALWSDIAMANRPALLAALAGYRAALDRLTVALSAADESGLRSYFGEAQAARLACTPPPLNPETPAP